jgi:MFS family permease
MAGLLDRERIIARPGFNRWLVPPAGLAVHLSIGSAYGFSVFWLPLNRAIGITESRPCPADFGFFDTLLATSCDWKVSWLTVMYQLFFVFLGLAAALFGGWLERAGPRKAGVAAAFCWGGGLMLAAVGIYLHQILLLWLGAGVLGGAGLGLGYISPVSTLIKWFPDRRGMATGMAIMGFGGGAMIGAPLADLLMRHFQTPSSVGAWETFAVMGAVYFVAMLAGSFAYRLPAPDWKPAGWTPRAASSAMITHRNVHLRDSWKTPQFWLLWTVLWLNVSAGIGVIGMASPMLQEVFGGRLIGVSGALAELSTEQRAAVATIGAAFAGLLSLFNIAGRIFWASLSDWVGRKPVYTVFFLLGIVLYALSPTAGAAGQVALFVGLFCVIITMYGGGFATIPAYLADIFGTSYVGAIHGRLLTAWGMAALLGPFLITRIREAQLARGIPAASVYNTTMYILAGLLLIGLTANLLVRPVAEKWYMNEADTTPAGGREHPGESA